MCRSDGRVAGYVVAVTCDPNLEACREFEIDQCLPKPLSTPTVIVALQSFWERAMNSVPKEDCACICSDGSQPCALDAAGTDAHLESTVAPLAALSLDRG
mmetsp:Transcript_25597/g.65045  ORF Transcript_25597/g.65045 Transcript_25597/m.65045 type:complete len:100 (+) Transcript_25597:905-1204(+)